ncbi:MAG: tetratricopeptide repeat protein, partial [Myxococcota bacterium]
LLSQKSYLCLGKGDVRGLAKTIDQLIASFDSAPHLQGRLAFTQARLARAADDLDPVCGELFERAAQFHAEAGDIALQAECLAESSFSIWHNEARFDEAMARCLRAGELYRETNDPHSEALLWHRLGGLYWGRANYDQVQRCYARAAELYRKSSNGPGEAEILARLGAMFNDIGQHHEAQRHMLQALALKERYGTTRWRLMSNIAVSTVNVGHIKEAFRWMERAEHQAVREGVSRPVVLLSQKSYLCLGKGDVRGLAKTIDQLTQTAEPDQPLSFTNLARLQYLSQLQIMQADFEAAEQTFRQLFEILRAYNNPLFIGHGQIERAKLLTKFKRLEEAEVELAGIPEVFCEDYPTGEAALNVAWAQLRNAQGQFQAAAERADAALAYYTRSDNRLNILTALGVRGLAAHGLGEDVEVWLNPMRRHGAGLELYPFGELSEVLLALRAAVPSAEIVTFLAY